MSEGERIWGDKTKKTTLDRVHERIHVAKLLRDMRECVAEATRASLFDPTVKEQMEKVRNVLRTQLQDLPVESSSVDRVCTLWASWSWSKKAHWLIKRRSASGRKEMRDRARMLEEIAKVLYRTILGEDGECDYDKVNEIYAEIVEKTKKWWYEGNPKGIVVANFSIKPMIPVDVVRMNCTIAPFSVSNVAEEKEYPNAGTKEV